MSTRFENRKYDRVPVQGNPDIFFKVDQSTFQVLDIGIQGLRIRTDSPSQFSLTQILENCELNISGKSFQPLCGQVIHFLSLPGKGAEFGIQLSGVEAHVSDQLILKIEELRANYPDQP